MGSIASAVSAASLTASLTAAAVNELAVNVGFSTTIAGKTYAADVTYSGGQYVAADPTLSGAVATGASLLAAEDNLATRIDAIV
ncbi:MAG TPA: hypothetical protein VGG26_02665 [Terracidiphilus sp.]|jgi:hypothetical protein